jgi:hypothetical protein
VIVLQHAVPAVLAVQHAILSRIVEPHLLSKAVSEACAELGYTNVQLPVKSQPVASGQTTETPAKAGAVAQAGGAAEQPKKTPAAQKGKKDGEGKEQKERRPRAPTVYQVFMTLALVSQLYLMTAGRCCAVLTENSSIKWSLLWCARRNRVQ